LCFEFDRDLCFEVDRDLCVEVDRDLCSVQIRINSCLDDL
jgi:hypothetical protein